MGLVTQSPSYGGATTKLPWSLGVLNEPIPARVWFSGSVMTMSPAVVGILYSSVPEPACRRQPLSPGASAAKEPDPRNGPRPVMRRRAATMPWQSMTAGPMVQTPVLGAWEENEIVPLIVQAPSSMAPAVELKPRTGNATRAST